MTPMETIERAIDPALAELPARMTSDAARTLLLAICLQESELIHRRQRGGGPARGLPQFERGGVIAVLGHPSSNTHARNLCAAHRVRPMVADLLEAFITDDVLALGFARLLLWTDHRPLPDDMDAAWSYYLRNWRPGKPRPKDWPGNWATAQLAMREYRARRLMRADT